MQRVQNWNPDVQALQLDAGFGEMFNQFRLERRNIAVRKGAFESPVPKRVICISRWNAGDHGRPSSGSNHPGSQGLAPHGYVLVWFCQ